MKISDIRAKAVLLGLLTDIVGSIFVGVALALVIGIIAATTNTVSVTYSTLRQNFAVKLIGLFGTTLCTTLGGYVAGRMAKAGPVANSLIVGILSLLLGISTAAAFPGVTPPWKILIGCIVTIPAALLGGYIAARTKKI